MSQSGTRSRSDLMVLRIFAATIQLVLQKGTRKLRSADIAAAAETTESTVFRYFSTVDEILQRTYDHCWAIVNRKLEKATYDRPFMATADAQLIADMEALWSIRQDEDSKNAATLAFLFMRRRTEIFQDDQEVSLEQDRFERRIEQLCVHVLKTTRPSEADIQWRDPAVLQRLLLNYAATVWLTWFCMPVGNRFDLTREHDLIEEEAQMGVLVLLDRFKEGNYPNVAAADSNLRE